MTWNDFVVNADFTAYYDEIPDLAGVRLRSVHLDGWDPTVTLRLDLPRYPDRWEGAPGDTLQCQIQFMMVREFLMEGWRPPVTADVVLRALPEHRLAVEVAAPGLAVSFTANASVKAGKISVFTQDAEGGDGGARSFARALESRLYPTLPPVHVNSFYERV
ncbi:Imm50 family immunity protein [Streptomyces vinaceus]|uniref:Imm50 family immunity protein n=1 Tax=Streptomyces vinaceus TaxID=1960 RepID=UPI0036C0B109